MFSKTRLLLLGLIGLAIVVVALATPALLRAIPPRYLVRLPEPLQALALPEDIEPLLPTVAAPPAAAAGLLEQRPTPQVARVLAGTATPPATPTAMAIVQAEGNASPATAPPIATATQQPTAEPTPWNLPVSARITDFEHRFQDWNNCGPATLAMALSHFIPGQGQAEVAALLKPNPEDRNVNPQEMAAYVNNHTSLRAIARVNGDTDLLRRLLANNIPVIVEIGIDPPGEYRWLGWYGHYLLPVAYDDELRQFWVYDSWFGTSEEPLTNAHPDGRVLSYEDLDANWHQFNRSYIVLYSPEDEALVAQLLGDHVDDAAMWRDSLANAYEQALGNDEDAFAWFNLGNSYIQAGNHADAAVAFDQALSIGLPWRMLWYQSGPYEAYLKVGRYQDVVLLAETTLKDRPYFEESYYYLAMAQAALGDAESARANLQRAVDFNPNYTIAAEALAGMTN